MIRRPPRSTRVRSSAASDVYKRQIGDVRGVGLMIGVELVKDPDTREPDAEAMQFLAQYGLEHELIIISCGLDGNVIRFIPPLITTMEELDQAIDTIEAGLDAYEDR